MRELKFRAYSRGKKKFYYFTLNDLACDDAGFAETRNAIQNETDASEDEQFTGLKDKQGKEIYEGDIIKRHAFGNREINGKLGIVVYDEVEMEFVISIAKTNAPEGTFYDYDGRTFNPSEIKVIGNIHENSELLGVKP